MKKQLSLFFLFTGILTAASVKAQLHTLRFKDAAGLRQYFHYTGKNAPVISGHRGTYIKDYPENSVEAFEYVLNQTPAFFETDPRLTKDSVIVLLHDSTLDRTTTGKGKLSDYTWEEIKQLRLKDREGNITPYRIPTLQEAIDWARGKTILNLDKKDVPPEMTAGIIRKNKAEAFVMVTVHNAKQAKFYFSNNPEIMLSAFVKTEKALKEYEEAGIPWANMIAYIGAENKPGNKKMYNLLHQRGVKCMISAAPVYDKLPAAADRAEAYRHTFREGADILESDFPVEVANAIK